MTYDDYRMYILTCEYLGREPAGEYKRIHDHLMGLWGGMEFVVDSRFNQIVLYKGSEIFVEQNVINGHLWIHVRMETFFRDDMGMDNTGTQEFIKSIMEEYLRYTVGTSRSWSHSI
jgi:hypothetical protein